MLRRSRRSVGITGTSGLSDLKAGAAERARFRHDLQLGGAVKQQLGVAVMTVFEHGANLSEVSSYTGRHRQCGFTLKLLAPDETGFSLSTVIKQPGQMSVLGQKQAVELRGADDPRPGYRRWGDIRTVPAEDLLPRLLADTSPEFRETVDALMAQVTVKSLRRALQTE